MHRSEKEMSIKFEKFIKKEFGNSYFKEYQGLFGRPDFIIYDKKPSSTSTISFELKLRNWKRAAIQAFRYRSFSDVSYVVLSKAEINSKEFSTNHFKKYNIGLAEFDKNCNFRVIHKPITQEPYSEELKLKLHAAVGKSRKRAKNLDQLFA